MTTIALLHYSAPPIIGGVESVLEHHARLFAAAGHKVRTIAGRGQVFDRRVQHISVPLVDSQHSRVVSAKAALDQGQVPASFEPLVEDIFQRLQNHLRGVEILFAHNVCSLHKNLALTAALRRISEQKNTPRLVAWNHDIAATSARYQDDLHAGFPWELLSSAWPGVTYVTISRSRQLELSQQLGLPAEEIRVVPNGIDPERFLRLGGAVMDLSEKLDLWAASPLLLLPARITLRKNIELAMKTLAELRHQLPAATLVVTGPPGPHNSANAGYFDQLKELRSKLGLQNSVHFLAELVQKPLTSENVADLFRLADGVLLTSREEGFGIPVLEAGISGLPLFCSDIPPLRDLGEQDVRFFPADADPEDVAQTIASALLSSKEYRLSQRVKKEFTWQRIYQQHLEPLLQL